MNEMIRTLSAIIFDFDGVFTNNKVLVFEDGREAVICDRSDGLGIERLKRIGIPLLVLSTEKNLVVKARCAKLGLECAQGISKKIDYLREWALRNSVDLARAMYVGNDTNDLECMAAVGCPVAVADAYPEALSAAKIVLVSNGGNGALRELAVMIEKALMKTSTDSEAAS